MRVVFANIPCLCGIIQRKGKTVVRLFIGAVFISAEFTDISFEVKAERSFSIYGSRPRPKV